MMSRETVESHAKQQFTAFFNAMDNLPVCGSPRHRDYVRCFLAGAFGMVDPRPPDSIADHLKAILKDVCEDNWVPDLEWYEE